MMLYHAYHGRRFRHYSLAEMLDIIKQSRVFDLGYYNNSLVGEFANHFAAFATKDIS